MEACCNEHWEDEHSGFGMLPRCYDSHHNSPVESAGEGQVVNMLIALAEVLQNWKEGTCTPVGGVAVATSL